jgi:CTP synthase (UTP-ammonia lyase)
VSHTLNIAIIGEFNPSFVPHEKTNAALGQMCALLALHIDATWISTGDLYDEPQAKLSLFDAIWIAPGSPYRSMLGALKAIRFARETETPLLGTCGGGQHVIIEYARNVLGFDDAHHPQYDPHAANLFVMPLSSALAGRTMEVHLEPRSRVAEIYGATRVEERYYCNFGLNPKHQRQLHAGGLVTVGRDSQGESHILTLEDHPFFVATHFIPQLTSTPMRPHPLIAAFVRAAFTRQMYKGRC